jgi:hypothetical protein
MASVPASVGATAQWHLWGGSTGRRRARDAQSLALSPPDAVSTARSGAARHCFPGLTNFERALIALVTTVAVPVAAILR